MREIALAAGIALTTALASCDTDAQLAPHNLSKAEEWDVDISRFSNVLRIKR